MSIDSILKSGLEGIHRGLKGATENARKISEASDPDSGISLEEPLIGLKQDENQVKASAKVVKVAERLQDEILDIIA